MPVLKNLDENGIMVLTLSRPDALNALNQQLIDELHKCTQEVDQDALVRGIIITGDGQKAFVAGADIKELSVLNESEARKLAEKGQKLFQKIENSSKPYIAAINGFALGGGCELAMACHIRIASENAKLGQPELNLGIIPGYGATQRLPQLVGRSKALEIILTGGMVSAREAIALGLVNQVIADQNSLLPAAVDMMKKIIAKSPLAIARVIAAVNSGYSFETVGYKTEAELFAASTSTEDFKEGTRAFLEKRKPEFKGK